MVETAGVSTTEDAVIGATVIVVDVRRPSDDAKTNAVPAPTAVATPSADTLTTDGAPDVQVTGR